MKRRFRHCLAVGLLACATALWSASDDPLTTFPVLPKPIPEPANELPPRTVLAPGVAIIPGRAVVLAGSINIEQGPPDGLEVLACLAGGKQHESLIRLDTADGAVVKAASIAALGLEHDGMPAFEASGQPARGWPIALTVRWVAGGITVALPASCLIRDRVTDRPYPPLPWIYTGSRFQELTMSNPDGQIQRRRTFMLDVTKSLAVNYDEPDALLASPFPGARSDQRFEVYSGAVPPIGTAVEVVLERGALPLTLISNTTGELREAATGPVLDDATLKDLLHARYRSEAAPSWHAVAVTLPNDAPREQDTAIHQRLMRLAALAQVWVVPVSTAAR